MRPNKNDLSTSKNGDGWIIMDAAARNGDGWIIMR